MEKCYKRKRNDDSDSKRIEEDHKNVPITTEQESSLLELYGGFFDLFFALFNNILYQSTNYPEEAYFYAHMFGMRVPICEHVKVAEYIEISCKKLVALLCTNSLDGFQLNLTDHSIVLQRFVFEVEGSFNFKTNRLSIKNDLETLAEHGRSIIRKLNSSDDIRVLRMKIGSKCPRFQIVLGLNETAMETYKDRVHGPFTGDSDIDFFPWSKPRVKPCDVDTIPITAKENSPSPNKSEEQGGSLTPTRNTTRVLPIAKTSLFENSLRLNFYSITYAKQVNLNLTPRSGFSSRNIDSPGLYHGRGRVAFPGRKSPGSPWNKSREAFLAGRQKSALIPTSSPLRGNQETEPRPKSARSLDAAFEKTKRPESSLHSLSGASGRINKLM